MGKDKKKKGGKLLTLAKPVGFWAKPVEAVIAKVNAEKLEVLAKSWGVDEQAALNVAIAEQYVVVVSSIREAEGD